MAVLENSVAEFVERWKGRAASAVLYPRPEGSPLIEALVGGRVLYLLDRTGPYTAHPGEGLVIVHPVAETVIRLGDGDGHEEQLQAIGVSRVQATGTVLETARGFVVLQARVPLVVGVFDDSWRGFKPGDPASFESLEPVHGFYLGRSVPGPAKPRSP